MLYLTTTEMWERLSQPHREQVFAAENLYFVARAHDLPAGTSPTSDQAIRHYFKNTGPHFTVIMFDVENPLEINQPTQPSKVA